MRAREGTPTTPARAFPALVPGYQAQLVREGIYAATELAWMEKHFGLATARAGND